MYLGVLPACMSSYHMHAVFSEAIGLPETEVTDGYKSLWECWEMNQGTLEEQLVFLITEPSLQTLDMICLMLKICY